MTNMDVSKNWGYFPPKWMVKIMENPIKMDDFGVPLFLETPTCLLECSKDESETLLPKKNSIRSDSPRILEQSHRPKRRKSLRKNMCLVNPFFEIWIKHVSFKIPRILFSFSKLIYKRRSLPQPFVSFSSPVQPSIYLRHASLHQYPGFPKCGWPKECQSFAIPRFRR